MSKYAKYGKLLDCNPLNKDNVESYLNKSAIPKKKRMLTAAHIFFPTGPIDPDFKSFVLLGDLASSPSKTAALKSAQIAPSQNFDEGSAAASQPIYDASIRWYQHYAGESATRGVAVVTLEPPRRSNEHTNIWHLYGEIDLSYRKHRASDGRPVFLGVKVPVLSLDTQLCSLSSFTLIGHPLNRHENFKKDSDASIITGPKPNGDYVEGEPLGGAKIADIFAAPAMADSFSIELRLHADKHDLHWGDGKAQRPRWSKAQDDLKKKIIAMISARGRQDDQGRLLLASARFDGERC